ncbi:hypothetical protein KDD30_18880 (plasmid) [Photobacterium sp. GJ3]|uniref:hypothetical protein n=1 Tax=Photobacterium sp. GJ3 TaxID=2829502 RepID=UPI001B8B4EA2|nr:hypothetical protein [Photobacterium sp. GJ3]QUJ70194.1 hypothetical protein KDD30_18880 [Photobacterium sp. GJ3]
MSINEGVTTALPLVNGGAENQDLTGWTLEQGYWRVLEQIDNITASEGQSYFSARPNDSTAGGAAYDDLSQVVDLHPYQEAIDQSSAFLRLSFSSNGWGDGDHAVVTLQAQDASGNNLGEPSVIQTESQKQTWLTQTSSMRIPANARSVKLTLRAVKKSGSMADVHLDDFQLSLTQP